MKKMILGMLMVMGVVGLMAGMAMAEASTNSVNINLLVTPIVTANLTVNTSYYNFGIVAVKTSTCSVTALVITNNGTGSIRVDKSIWTADWDLTKSSTVMDGFGLFAMVNSTAPVVADYVTKFSSFTKVAQGYNALTNRSAAAVTMIPDATQNLWFRLDMPKSTSSNDQKTIHVRLKATTQ